EPLTPRYDLSAVGRLEHAVTELREVAAIMRRGLTSAAPMGMILMGPPGTGKSFLAECFAKECGMLCVRFRRLGLLSAAPMGMILMGPPGTGKSFLAECFAKECGMLCVRFRPLRNMYLGQSERNQEKPFSAIRALA